MSRTHMLRRLVSGCLFATVIGSGAAFAQASKSGSLAQELVKLLEAGKLDAIAIAQGDEPDRFIAVLYYPGQLLVVSAKYAAPPLLMERLKEKAYRDIYIDLNSASVPDSRVFIQDVGADGLKPKADGGVDGYERGAKTKWAFDGDWRKQKMASEDEYMKDYVAADAEYTAILRTLIQKVK